MSADEPMGIAWNRYCELTNLNKRKNEKYKVKLPTAFRIVGVTQLRFGNLPPELQRKIKQNLLRGYAVTRNGNAFAWTQAVLRACPSEEVHIGYVCRQYMKLWVYLPTKKEHVQFKDALTALCSLTGKVQAPHMEFAPLHSSPNWVRVKGSGGWKEGSEGLRFEEVRKFVDVEMAKTLAQRQRVVQWFESGPKVNLTFANR